MEVADYKSKINAFEEQRQESGREKTLLVEEIARIHEGEKEERAGQEEVLHLRESLRVAEKQLKPLPGLISKVGELQQKIQKLHQLNESLCDENDYMKSERRSQQNSHERVLERLQVEQRALQTQKNQDQDHRWYLMKGVRVAMRS